MEILGFKVKSSELDRIFTDLDGKLKIVKYNTVFLVVPLWTKKGTSFQALIKGDGARLREYHEKLVECKYEITRFTAG